LEQLEEFDQAPEKAPPVASGPDYSDSSQACQVIEIPEGMFWRKHPDNKMTSQEFVDNLTPKGRQLLEMLLAEEDMKKWAEFAEDEDRQKGLASIKLGMWLLERLQASDDAKNELQLALQKVEEIQSARPIPSVRPAELASQAPAETTQPNQPQDNIDLLIAGLSGEEVGELWNTEVYEGLRRAGKNMELALIMNAEANASLSHKLQTAGLTADVVMARLQGAISAPISPDPTSTPAQPDMPDQLRDDVDRYLGTLSEHGLYFLYYAKGLDDMLRLANEDPRLNPDFAHRIQSDIQLLMQTHGVSETEIREKMMDWFETRKRVPLIEEVTFVGNAESMQLHQEVLESAQASRDKEVFQVTLDPQMSNQEFVDALTPKGKEMLKELLLLADIRDAQAIQELEQKPGKSGYVKLAMHVADRICASAKARKELCEALKGHEKSSISFVQPGATEAEPTVSPWTTQPPAETATNFERVIDQFLSEISDEERIELKQDVFREEDDEVRPAGAVTSRLIQRLVKSWEIDFTGDKLKRLLAPRMNR
jgi:hypothetical protein